MDECVFTLLRAVRNSACDSYLKYLRVSGRFVTNADEKEERDKRKL